MNFQAVTQANGNNVTMFGTFNEVGGVSLTQNQKQVCKCQIIDDNGVKHGVRLYGTMPSPNVLNTRQQFTISTFQGNYKGKPYKGYSGFWNSDAQVAPQNTQQAPSQPAQATNPQQPATPQGKKEPDWDAIARGKVRNSVVCAFISAPIDAMPSIEDIEYWVNYIMTGINPNISQQQVNANPDYVGDNPPPPQDDDIPF